MPKTKSCSNIATDILFEKVSGLIKRHSTSEQLLVPVGKAVSDTTLLKVKTGLEPSQQPWKSELVTCFTQESVGRLLQECIIYYTSSSPSSVSKLSSDNTLGSEKASPARIPKAVEKKKRSAHRYGLLSKRSKKVKMKTHNQEETSFQDQIPADSKPVSHKLNLKRCLDQPEKCTITTNTSPERQLSRSTTLNFSERNFLLPVSTDNQRLMNEWSTRCETHHPGLFRSSVARPVRFEKVLTALQPSHRH
ncbi:hypothetical protein DPEC_G00054850 [Dallia pectoralis]|uniref:Uncharacterized protein n=1 Tax=Dallia pectoralis TaxID=75939 RepID=A0ACC2H5D4_DALPE|nr:hypothetical protein DPEC_G00054850 [Dallia pectoralis]